ncbi:PAS domain-containing sensor histidine kinase [Mesorhizobium sp. BAC0120]|uniref:sensor histidine kinase n=1 Tax=Mesorhizobium sp. BAC0120 TaxID=3090670 RepID=UPI00298CD54E|nr:PAS domain-containing sensor histidine kinase [Mesorhizobium sp. BAC0120]MDW6021071.1 PAS domain-containing sensor histidine kinase [Mesorhizobium sp. BAC0120]
MSAFVSRWHECLGGVSSAAERFAYPAEANESASAGPRRLFILALLAPVLLAAGLVQTLADRVGASKIVALVCLVIAFGWLTGLMLSITRARLAEFGLLVIISVSTAAIVAGAGGLSSPFALLTAMPLAEALWVRRDRTAMIAGGAASVVTLLLQGWIGLALDLSPPAPTSWHWLIPAAYLASILVRARTFLAERERNAAERRPITAEDIIDAAVLRLSKTGEVLDAGGKVERLTGLQPSLLLGAGLFDRIHVGDRVAWLCALSDLRDGAPSRKLELRVRAPRGMNEAEENYPSFVVEVAETGDLERPLIAVLRPNDEVVALRAELAALRANAGEVDLAKSRFLGVVSHELRTPLNAIIGFSDMLENEMFGPFANPRQKEYAGLIRESGNHLLAVVTSILDVSKIECGSYPIEPESFAFRDAVETCRSMMSLQAARKSLSLEADIAPSVGNIVGDRRAVQQMLINLISNAVKFTPTGGTVKVGANRLGSRLHFWVSDTGIGIKQEDLARLGRPFTQVRNDYTREYEGAGLGLSLVKGLVELHHGSMMIESAPGEGTVVTISLPIAGPAARAAAGDAPKVIQLQNDEVPDGQIRKIA